MMIIPAGTILAGILANDGDGHHREAFTSGMESKVSPGDWTNVRTVLFSVQYLFYNFVM